MMVKGDEYGGYAFYTCMNTEHQNLQKSYWEGAGRKGRIIEGMKQTKVCCMHIWKCYSEIPVKLIHANKMLEI
jgi:hypothetical protein